MTRPMDVVRARNHDTGDHYTTTRHLATQRGDRILEDRPTVDQYGRWLDPTPHKTLTPSRDNHGRYASDSDPAVDYQANPLGDHNGDEAPTDQPFTGEEEA